MFKITWDIETGGVLLSTKVAKDTLGVSPRPVFFEELDLLGLDRLGYAYPRCEAPLMWAVNKQYFYRGELMFEAKGANIYDAPSIVFKSGKETATIEPINVEEMLRRNNDQMFLLENEAIEFIRDTYTAYSGVNRAHDTVKANQVIDFEALVEKFEKKTKQKMAVVKEDCDSFDVVPLDVANAEGKRVLLSTRIDRFIASFSGGKDSQVVLDLVTRAIPPTAFEVIYSDTGYELPPSLDLYEEVKRHYSQLFPALRFSIARNHESVLNYWDKIGTPSDTQRWCCAVMKTGPLYRRLKTEDNKQAKVLAFEGVRAEESTRRSGYERIGKGVKHNTTINARPILRWSASEIFLYLFKYSLPINPAYRQGMTRVGCVICPFASEWNEFIANKNYGPNVAPFLLRIEKYAQKAGVKDLANYISQGNWKRRISGNLLTTQTHISFKTSNNTFIATIENAQTDVLTWLIPIGQLSLGKKGNGYSGSLTYKHTPYPINISKSKNKTIVEVNSCTDATLISSLKRSCFKIGYCIQCEVCEVECPTGALSILPKPKIEPSKCIHCQKCLSFHDKGCIVAASLYQTTTKNMNTQSRIDRYKNFGLKEEWVDAFFASPEDYWDSDNGLNKTYQVPSLRNWLIDAEIIDEKLQLTPLGHLLNNIYSDNPSLVWEIIWINLSYNSPIVNWFSSKIICSQIFSSKLLEEMFKDEYASYKDVTVHNAIYQLLRTLRESPIGEEMGQLHPVDAKGTQYVRKPYDDLSPEAVAYSIYKYAYSKDVDMIRVSDLFNPEESMGIVREFGINKNELLKKFRSLHSDTDRVITAELAMGLDHITLKHGFTPIQVLEILTK